MTGFAIAECNKCGPKLAALFTPNELKKSTARYCRACQKAMNKKMVRSPGRSPNDGTDWREQRVNSWKERNKLMLKGTK
jgi:cytochrome c2